MEPSIHDDENKNQEAKDDQDDCGRLGLPKQMDIFQDALEIHAQSMYTLAAQSETEGEARGMPCKILGR